MRKNALKKIRESQLLSKTELARKANISPITLSRIEEGKPCRMETQRKILMALGLNFSERSKVFEDEGR
ncbi:MAG: helix-turn-helix transcriptional regulator [Thermodesulfobacteriota bacterium]